MRLTKAASRFVLLPTAVPFALFAQDGPSASSLTFPFTLQFDCAYIRNQGNDHQKSLQMPDTMLIPPAARNPSLSSFRQQMRATVAQHLANAQSLLAHCCKRSTTGDSHGEI
jgi:hypothetical protein